MSVADVVIALTISSWVRSLCLDSSRATTPETAGVAIDVPLSAP